MVRQPLSVEYALLGLVRERPMHGYEIYQRLRAGQGLGLVWQVKQGLLYAMLNRLEEDGLLTASLEARGARPPRKLWQLTPEGARDFAVWLRKPVEHGRDVRVEFLAKLFFAWQDGALATHTLIEAQRAMTTGLLAKLKERAAALERERSYDWLVLRYRIGQLEAALQWFDECAGV